MAFILVVDDDKGIQDVLQETLEFAGYDVRTANDGLDALNKLDQELPRLILLDVMMPRMDGPAFVATLKQRGLRSTLPIVVLSASGQVKQHATCLEAEGYLGKPFTIDELLQEVERVLQ